MGKKITRDIQHQCGYNCPLIPRIISRSKRGLRVSIRCQVKQASDQFFKVGISGMTACHPDTWPGDWRDTGMSIPTVTNVS